MLDIRDHGVCNILYIDMKNSHEQRVSLRNKITTVTILVVLFLGLTVSFAIKQILPGALKNLSGGAGAAVSTTAGAPAASAERYAAGIEGTINRTLGVVIGITIAAIVLSIFIGSALAGLITRPVGILQSATREMSAGNLDVDVDIKTGDEIQSLAKSFNEMSARLKKSYEELLETNRDLERANRVKSQFLAIMSHELRTPLTAIIGFSELLAEGTMGPLNDEQKRSLREVLHNSADLLNMINNMLDLTRIESEKLRLDVKTFDVLHTLKRAYDTMLPLAQRKGLRFHADIQEDIPIMDGDERKIQQAVLNLLSNAIKFTPKGGNIRMTVRHFDKFSSYDDSSSLQRHFENPQQIFSKGGISIAVEDDGIGIPEDHVGRIFDIFQQVDSSETRAFGGLGLGLAIAKNFVSMHGGRIWVESQSGKGARFIVVIPYPSK